MSSLSSGVIFLRAQGLGLAFPTMSKNGFTLTSRKHSFLNSFNQVCSTNYVTEFPPTNVSCLCFFSI